MRGNLPLVRLVGSDPDYTPPLLLANRGTRVLPVILVSRSVLRSREKKIDRSLYNSRGAAYYMRRGTTAFRFVPVLCLVSGLEQSAFRFGIVPVCARLVPRPQVELVVTAPRLCEHHPWYRGPRVLWAVFLLSTRTCLFVGEPVCP